MLHLLHQRVARTKDSCTNALEWSNSYHSTDASHMYFANFRRNARHPHKCEHLKVATNYFHWWFNWRSCILNDLKFKRKPLTRRADSPQGEKHLLVADTSKWFMQDLLRTARWYGFWSGGHSVIGIWFQFESHCAVHRDLLLREPFGQHGVDTTITAA